MATGYYTCTYNPHPHPNTTHIYACTDARAHINVCLYIYLHTLIYTNTHVQIYIHTYILAHTLIRTFSCSDICGSVTCMATYCCKLQDRRHRADNRVWFDVTYFCYIFLYHTLYECHQKTVTVTSH